MPTISYAITTHNEDGRYLRALIGALLQHKAPDDEIVILDDFSTNADTIAEITKVGYHQRQFAGDFAEHKNYLNGLCKGTHIFQLDADELVHPDFIRVLPEVLMMNPSVELFTLARINIVQGLTEDDIIRWGWRVDDRQRINFPDRQGRIYANKPGVEWKGKVHEKIVGHTKHSDLPEDDEYCLLHVKDIIRQRDQNDFYSTL